MAHRIVWTIKNWFKTKHKFIFILFVTFLKWKKRINWQKYCPNLNNWWFKFKSIDGPPYKFPTLFAFYSFIFVSIFVRRRAKGEPNKQQIQRHQQEQQHLCTNCMMLGVVCYLVFYCICQHSCISSYSLTSTAHSVLR